MRSPCTICGEFAGLMGSCTNVCIKVSNDGPILCFRLVPSVLLTFVHDQPNEMGNYLKDDLLMLIQDI